MLGAVEVIFIINLPIDKRVLLLLLQLSSSFYLAVAVQMGHSPS